MKTEPKSEEKSAVDAFGDLVEIVHRLRAPGGCPWDRDQTAKTLKQYIVEETYEVLDAIDGGSPEELCEELGDLLLQVVLQAEIASEQGTFAIGNVIENISRKLVERHPHVFGEVKVSGANEVVTNWERLKQSEKEGRGLFDGLPRQLPALQLAARMGEKAARVGFDWPESAGVRAKVEEEMAELDEAAAREDPEAIEHEIGDLLFSAAQWARHLHQQPEEALRGACRRFAERFARMEQVALESGDSMRELDIDRLERLWQEAKAR